MRSSWALASTFRPGDPASPTHHADWVSFLVGSSYLFSWDRAPPALWVTLPLPHIPLFHPWCNLSQSANTDHCHAEVAGHTSRHQQSHGQSRRFQEASQQPLLKISPSHTATSSSALLGTILQSHGPGWLCDSSWSSGNKEITSSRPATQKSQQRWQARLEELVGRVGRTWALESRSPAES